MGMIMKLWLISYGQLSKETFGSSSCTLGATGLDTKTEACGGAEML
jgi:hypothetical protein